MYATNLYICRLWQTNKQTKALIHKANWKTFWLWLMLFVIWSSAVWENKNENLILSIIRDYFSSFQCYASCLGLSCAVLFPHCTSQHPVHFPGAVFRLLFKAIQDSPVCNGLRWNEKLFFSPSTNSGELMNKFNFKKASKWLQVSNFCND